MRLCVLVLVAACQFQPGHAPNDVTTDAATDAPVDVMLVDACAGCPANDVPGGAEQITGTGVISVAISNAHDDASTSCGGAGGRDLFYELVVPTQQVIYMDTDTSTADAAIAIYDGPCSALASELVCSNDACDGQTFAQIARTFAPGTYCMIVDEATTSASSTNFVLDIYFAGRDGRQLTGTSPITFTGDTCSGSDLFDPLPSCETAASNPGTAKEHMFWYTQCPGSHSVTASTCDAVNYDSIVYIRNRAGAGFCADDGCVTGKGSYTTGSFTGTGFLQVIVDGWDGGCGTYTLTVTF